MQIKVALLDGATPALAAWLKDLNPAASRALMRVAGTIRRAALKNVNATFERTGQRRTSTRTFKDLHGGRQRVKIATRGIRIRQDQAAGIRSVRIWHGSGILAAHELGSTIPPTTIRFRTRHGTRVWNRRAFTLPRRPTLIPAYEANAGIILPLLEAEYQKLLKTAPPAVRTP